MLLKCYLEDHSQSTRAWSNEGGNPRPKLFFFLHLFFLTGVGFGEHFSLGLVKSGCFFKGWFRFGALCFRILVLGFGGGSYGLSGSFAQ